MVSGLESGVGGAVLFGRHMSSNAKWASRAARAAARKSHHAPPHIKLQKKNDSQVTIEHSLDQIRILLMLRYEYYVGHLLSPVT